MANSEMAGLSRRYLLVLTAGGELATGLALLAIPAIPLRLLMGIEHASSEAMLMSRVAGAALLGIASGCWLGRNDQWGLAQRGIIAGVVIYSAAAACLLAHAGLFLDLVGIALWPAVAVHVGLVFWGVFSFWNA